MNRTIDEHLLMELADQVGLADAPASRPRSSAPNRTAGAGHSSPSEADLQREARKVAESMKGKSDSEILAEIMKVKAVLQKNPGAYEKQIRAVKSLRGMMNPEQRQRLDQVLHLLER